MSMSRILYILLFTALFTFSEAAAITKNEAKIIATEFLERQKGINGITNGNDVLPNVDDSLECQIIRNNYGDVVLYLFRGKTSFCIVSAHESYKENILAYSTENTFDIENGSPISKWLLNKYVNDVTLAKRKKNVNNEAANINYGSGKLLRTANWGQNGSFWWNACPKYYGSYTYAGCGAAAMAIIMKYHNWPRRGKGSNSYSWHDKVLSVDFASTTYDWKIAVQDSPYSGESQNEIAKILYHAGVSVNMDYGVSASSSISTDIGPALVNHFKYKVHRDTRYYPPYYHEWRNEYSEEEWVKMMKSEIDSDRPFICGGKSETSYHFFVCDGYDSSGRFHFNLGWAGNSNGYYSLSSVGGSYNITLAVVGIEPDRESYPDEDNNNSDPEQTEHQYVDLGLSVKWATCNLGANNPEDFGNYYAWGETSTKADQSSWYNYKYSNSDGTVFSKYSFAYCNLEPEDDAATVNWGKEWRMPTMEEFNELRNYCVWTYTTRNGVKGYEVVGRNGNSIFLPQAGMQLGVYNTNVGQGRYWSSSICYNNISYASYLLFDSAKVSWYMVDRCYAHSVRPVYTSPTNIVPIYDEVNNRNEYYDISGRKTTANSKGITISFDRTHKTVSKKMNK